MTNSSLLIIMMLVAAGLGGVGLLLLTYARPRSDFRSLMGNAGIAADPRLAEYRDRLENDESGEELEHLKRQFRKGRKKFNNETLADRMFKAGIFSEQEKRDFKRRQVLSPVVLSVVGTIIGFVTFPDPLSILLFFLVGGIGGFYLPYRTLNGRVKTRDEEILYYLPLVIEQVAIGVSSSLDIGPCIQRIVQMADERDTHNAVSELLRFTQAYVKSGASLEEALTEVGKLAGHTELKHAFMAMSQVAKFGGEVTKQLQELADAVSSQRETKIESKIKKLELEATGPVALVFLGFLVILLIGFGLQLKGQF